MTQVWVVSLYPGYYGHSSCLKFPYICVSLPNMSQHSPISSPACMENHCVTAGTAFPGVTGGAKFLYALKAQEFINALPFKFLSVLLLFLPFLFPAQAGKREQGCGPVCLCKL